MPSKDKATYGPVPKKRAKRLLEALLAYVNWELEDVAGISLSHKWQDETTKQPKLVIKTQLRTLEFLTAKDKHEGQLTKTQIRQALNDHLKDFLQILEDNRTETQGKEEWHFTLKLWSKDKEKNLEQFEIEWQDKRPEKSKRQEETLRETVVETFHETSLQKNEGINWQEICQQNLTLQKQLTTNPFTNTYGVTPQLDEIYVPLAIVERKPPKSPSRNQAEEKEEEKLIPIAEERFFEDVLRQGKSQISQGRKIAIIGEPGSGKTTRLQKIADWILEQDLGLPIWISLADLTQPTITQYIEEIWLKQTGKSLTIDELSQQKERIWLLLDGLDEMTSKVETRHVSALLGGWVQGLRVVVTCRVNVWEADKNAFSGFDVFRNLQFNPEQVRDYIRRWFAGMGDAATGQSLEAALTESENSRLKELIQNPLRLWMLCQIWQTGGGLPETQAGLYGQFVELVYRWKADEEILDQREAIDTALAQLALAAMEQKDEVSRLRLPESWVLKVLGSRPIFQAVMKLGWLNRVERFPEAICVFYHASFQEYFAALAVDDWDYFLPRNHVNFPVVGKEYRIFEPQWKQVILLWLGRGDVADEEKWGFIDKLVNFDDGCGEFYWYKSCFLAAAAINEFKGCSLASEIVRQVVKWGFGYFNEDKKEWLTFLKFIEEGARQAILQTEHKCATQELYHILEHPQCPEETRMELADSLGTINSGNPQAVAALVKIIETTDDKIICTQAAECLKKIGKGNPQAIGDLIGFIGTIETIESEYNRIQTVIMAVIMAAGCLKEIGKGNPQAIAGLIRVIETNEYEFTCMLAANCLEKIGKGNPQAIAGLIKVIETTESEYTRAVSNNILQKIANQEIQSENQEDIDSLIENLQQTRDKLTYYRTGAYETPTPGLSVVYETDCWMAAYKLSKFAKDNPKAINNLMYFLHNYNYWTRKQELFFSKKIQENENSISELMNFFEDIADNTKIFPCRTMLKINILNYKDFSERINILIKIISDLSYEDMQNDAIELLQETISDDPTYLEMATNDLSLRIEQAESDYLQLKNAFALCKINPSYVQAFNQLIQLIINSQDILGYSSVVNQAKFHLKEIATTKQMPLIVNSLKCCLSNEIYSNEFERFESCFDVIWHCAENLPYPQFYRAWHGLTETQTSPLVQTLNLAQLPQLLQTQLTETNLHQTLQLLCIDGSKFDNPDNPATDIYLQLVKKYHCPKCTEGTPRTLTELKIYWELLDWEKHPILIFYEEANPQGFSQTFLDSLSRFDATICVITDSPHPTITTFLPQDPHLIQTIMNWLQRTILEA